MPSKLEIFDFDGTLFNSPCDTPENRTKYERATKIPWLVDKETSRRLSKEHGRFIGLRRGWWGRPETLEPPLVPDPAPAEWFNRPVCDAFAASKNNPEVKTVILTGRYVGLKGHVLRILSDGKLAEIIKKTAKDGKAHYQWADADSDLFCLGEDGPKPEDHKPSETFPWKVWVIGQYLKVFPEVRTLEVWEDRAEHVEQFNAFGTQLGERGVIVHHVQ